MARIKVAGFKHVQSTETIFRGRTAPGVLAKVRTVSTLLAGAGLIGLTGAAWGQSAAPAPAANALPAQPAAVLAGVVRSIAISGAERLEPETVRSYIGLKVGDSYDRERLDQALKELYASELFADVQIRDDASALTIVVRENPVINRIVLEGNKRLKEDKIRPEIKLAPRQIFTRSKTRADVARIIQLYRRQGRFGATVEPKTVALDQNRVDVVFEIHEGPKSKVRQINIIGNKVFSDGTLRGQMVTKRATLAHILSSGTSYDPDRMAFDQQKMRQFYLTNGYADFRIASAVAELTPDNRDFIITYVVDEGDRYKFGDVKLESQIRDLKPALLQPQIRINKGDWYDAKKVEDTVTALTDTAGQLGYAFADIGPQFNRDKPTKTMGVTFKVNEAPRVYVERVDINGNTITRDKVVRREFRLAEGDAFNSFKVKRSNDRIQSLGYFQDKLEIEQKQGSTPDRVILSTSLEEKQTGELQVSAGYSSLERFIVDLSIRQRNFRGLGQELRASVSYSTYSKSIDLGFTEPYLFDKNIALGFDVFRRDYNSFNTIGGNRNTTYQQVTTGFQVRTGFVLTEYWSLSTRYGLNYDQISLDRFNYYTNGVCDPVLAGRYLCDALGNRWTSSVGYSVAFDNLNNRQRPTAGQRFVFSQDFAGLGGDVRYIRTSVQAAKYWGFGKGFVFSVRGEGGYIKGLGQDIRLNDRFFLGEPQLRGFQIRGVGPRVIRKPYDTSVAGFANGDGTFLAKSNWTDDALGGRAYYLGHLELELPLGSGARELGLRPSIFVDAGAVFGVRKPTLSNQTDPNRSRPVTDSNGNPLYIDPATSGYTLDAGPVGAPNQAATTLIPAFREFYFGNSAKPRLSVGFGVNWNSPFGPFRIDVAKALLKEPGDDTKLFSFNIGTQF